MLCNLLGSDDLFEDGRRIVGHFIPDTIINLEKDGILLVERAGVVVQLKPIRAEKKEKKKKKKRKGFMANKTQTNNCTFPPFVLGIRSDLFSA